MVLCPPNVSSYRVAHLLSSPLLSLLSSLLERRGEREATSERQACHPRDGAIF